MSILNITNLRDDPYKWLKDNIEGAIEEYEMETKKTFSNELKQFIHDSYDNLIEEFEETPNTYYEMLSFVDNLLVNEDYYATVKEIVDNQ